MKKFLGILLCLLNSIQTIANAATVTQNNSPFGPNVYVFNPSMNPADINATILQIYNNQQLNQFGTQGYAFMFMQGNYGSSTNPLDIRVGYYTHVMGLGTSPDDVVITGAFRTQDQPPTGPIDEAPGALYNFWRAAENLAVIPTLGSIDYPAYVPSNQNVWAVSQASPLRRIHVMGTLRLFDIGWSSGGFLADSKIDSQIVSGSQQQWVTRNSTFGSWSSGVWNMVFVGSTGTLPSGTWPASPFTSVNQTPVIREKPFIIFDTTSNQYAVMVPNLQQNSVGVDWSNPGVILPLTDFAILSPNTDTSATINADLQQGKHLIFTPGTYHLDDSIIVTNPHTIILGIGIPALVNNNNVPTMIISDVDGVMLAGILFDAGPNPAATLLQVGPANSTIDHSANPTFLYDIYCRVGGALHVGATRSCVTINSNNVVGDNFWLWRADHGSNVGWTVNPANNGLIINGNNVTFYGLAVEHFQQYQTTWNGNKGSLYFYQSEMPYDPPSQAAWMNGTTLGYASYKVAPTVTIHSAWGLGVYNLFEDAAPLFSESAIEAPLNCGVQFTHMLTYWLNGGQVNTGINHVIDDQGGANSQANPHITLNSWPWNTSLKKSLRICK